MKIAVYSDYVCPYCFLAEEPLANALDHFDGEIEAEWMPFELRPYPVPTLRPEGQYLQKAWRESVYPLAERFGLEIVLPRVSPQPYTRLAFEGGLFARDEGAADDYHHRVFRAFFQEERDIGELDELTECARDIGLDAAAFRRALEKDTYSKECGEQLRHATDVLGIQSVPTIVIGTLAVPGLMAEDTLVKLLQDQLDKAG